MISTKGRYALRVMIDLAKHEGEGNIPLKDIAQRQEISKKYLEILVKELVKGGLVHGVSGKGGGYSLSRKPDEYTVGEILESDVVIALPREQPDGVRDNDVLSRAMVYGGFHAPLVYHKTDVSA